MTGLGGFSMIFSILQLISNLRAQRARNQEREELLALLREARERNAALTARVLELTELSGNRANGDGENSRGE